MYVYICVYSYKVCVKASVYSVIENLLSAQGELYSVVASSPVNKSKIKDMFVTLLDT